MSEEWERSLADAVVAEAAAERRRTRRERDLLEGEATFEAVVGSAVRHPEVVVVDAEGTEHRGALVSVGPDAVVLRRGDATTILPRRAVAAVGISGTGGDESGAALGATIGDDDAAIGPTLAELVAELADRELPVRVRIGTTTWAGTFRSAGEDVGVLALRAGPRRYVRLESVSEISA